MKTRLLSTIVLACATFLMLPAAQADPIEPHLNYQGRISVDDVIFEGDGQFKFALVNAAGDTTYWSNDDSSVAGSEPTAAVELSVARGLYAVRLGDSALTGMSAIPADIAENADLHLRIWFNDGVNGFDLLTPDQPFTPAAYALRAATADSAKTADIAAEAASVAAGSITAAQLDSALDADLARLSGDQIFTGNVTASSFTGDGVGLNNLLIDSLVQKVLPPPPPPPIMIWGDESESVFDVPTDLTYLLAVSLGYDHVLALRTDGTVMAWGDNDEGQATVPSELTNPEQAKVTAIAAGDVHSLALREDGTVVAWGDDSNGQATVPSELTNPEQPKVTAIAAGDYHSLALREDGTVVAWGNDSSGQSTVPDELAVTNPDQPKVTAIAAGGYHSLALREDGTVVAWGYDEDGESTVPSELANPVQAKVTAITAGLFHSLALREDGTVVAWGYNDDDQATVPDELTEANPEQAKVTAIAAGEYHSLALLENGTIVGWGDDEYGQATSPEELPDPAVTRIRAIAAGYDTSLVLYNSPDSSNEDSFTIKPVSVVLNNATGVTLSGTFTGDGSELNLSENVARLDTDQTFTGSITAGSFDGNGIGLINVPTDSLVLKTKLPPLLTVWGREDSDYLNVPADLTNVVGISGGNHHALALREDGTILAWGLNANGQSTVPSELADPALAKVTAMAAGGWHSLVLKENGTLVGWGYNSKGQSTVSSELANPELAHVVAIAAGAYFSLALREDGTIVAWGDDGEGQSTVPDELTNPTLAKVTAITAGTSHALALREDGTVVAWGDNWEGQSTVPEELTNPALAKVTAIAAGQLYSLALREDGTVVGWGDDYHGQWAVPDELTNPALAKVTAIAAGTFHSLALRENGTVVAWRANWDGQSTVPEELTNPALAKATAIAVGQYHSLVLHHTDSYSTKPVSVVLNDAEGVNLSGTFTGDGSGLTGLNFDENVALLDTDQTFTASVTAGSFTGDGSGLTNIDASNITSGTLDDARLSANVPLLNEGAFSQELITAGGLRMDHSNIWFGGGTDETKGLGWYRNGTQFGDHTPWGPVLFGYYGGALGTTKGGEKVTLNWDSSGSVGIGISEPEASLHVVQKQGSLNPVLRLQDGDDHWSFRVVNAGSNKGDLILRSSQIPPANVVIDAKTGAYSTPSDERLKKDIETLDAGLNAVLALRPTSYRFKTESDTAARSFGFIAQEVEEILPEIVTENGEYKGLTYDAFIPVAIRAIQEQQAQIERLESLLLEILAEREVQ